MKKIIAILLSLLAILSLIGCEKLPEEPEPTSTPSQSTPEPRDYYEDSAEATPEPSGDEGEEAEGDAEGDEGEEAEDEEDGGEEESSDSSDSSSSGSRTRSEVSEELHANVIVDDSEGVIGPDLQRSWRMMLPPLRAYNMSGRIQATPAPAEPGVEAPFVPEPIPNIDVRLNYTGVLTNCAYLNDQGIPMVNLSRVVTALEGNVPNKGAMRIISLKEEIAILDVFAGTINYKGIVYNLSAIPVEINGKLYVSIDLFSIFPGAKITNEENVVNIASPTSAGG